MGCKKITQQKEIESLANAGVEVGERNISLIEYIDIIDLLSDDKFKIVHNDLELKGILDTNTLVNRGIFKIYT